MGVLMAIVVVVAAVLVINKISDWFDAKTGWVLGAIIVVCPGFGEAVALDADHRRHATVELCIRDLKAGVGLRHCPSGKFNANAAWLLIATLAHNLLRWVAAIGLGARGELIVAKTLRRTLLDLPGRITRSARRLVLHLPASWPWEAWFELALARLRCIAYAT